MERPSFLVAKYLFNLQLQQCSTGFWNLADWILFSLAMKASLRSNTDSGWPRLAPTRLSNSSQRGLISRCRPVRFPPHQTGKKLLMKPTLGTAASTCLNRVFLQSWKHTAWLRSPLTYKSPPFTDFCPYIYFEFNRLDHDQRQKILRLNATFPDLHFQAFELKNYLSISEKDIQPPEKLITYCGSQTLLKHSW